MGFSADIPEVKTPATRPERYVDVEVEDVVVGDDSKQDPKQAGKRKLMRPKGNSVATNSPTTASSGLNV